MVTVITKTGKRFLVNKILQDTKLSLFCSVDMPNRDIKEAGEQEIFRYGILMVNHSGIKQIPVRTNRLGVFSQILLQCKFNVSSDVLLRVRTKDHQNSAT